MDSKIDFEQLKISAKKNATSWNKYLQKNKKQLESMDLQIHELHEKYSATFNCLECANCCRTLGPLITDKDIEKMSKHLKIKANEFYNRYLKTDEDGDMVFKNMPCPFLGEDNYCSIYESRPKACREYPHTDRKKFYQIYKLSIKNASTCPIVYNVMEEIKKL